MDNNIRDMITFGIGLLGLSGFFISVCVILNHLVNITEIKHTLIFFFIGITLIITAFFLGHQCGYHLQDLIR